MLRFNESVHIQQPVDRVFSFATDLNNNLEWQTDVLEVELTSGGSMGPGATYRCVNEFLGQRIETEGVVSEYEHGKKCSFTLTSGPVTGQSSFFFEPIQDGTRFTTTGELNLNMFRFAGWLIGRMAKEKIRNDLAKLKTILENGKRRALLKSH